MADTPTLKDIVQRMSAFYGGFVKDGPPKNVPLFKAADDHHHAPDEANPFHSFDESDLSPDMRDIVKDVKLDLGPENEPLTKIGPSVSTPATADAELLELRKQNAILRKKIEEMQAGPSGATGPVI